jgi:hypothetical protein
MTIPEKETAKVLLNGTFEIFEGPFAIRGTEYDETSIERVFVEVDTTLEHEQLSGYACYYLRYDDEWDRHSFKFDHIHNKVVCPLKLGTMTVIGKRVPKNYELIIQAEPESNLWIRWPVLVLFGLIVIYALTRKNGRKEKPRRKLSGKKSTLEMMKKTKLNQEEIDTKLDEDEDDVEELEEAKKLDI